MWFPLVQFLAKLVSLRNLLIFNQSPLKESEKDFKLNLFKEYYRNITIVTFLEASWFGLRQKVQGAENRTELASDCLTKLYCSQVVVRFKITITKPLQDK